VPREIFFWTGSVQFFRVRFKKCLVAKYPCLDHVIHGIRRGENAMSKINLEYDVDKVLKSKDKSIVLFYASWCPFSQKFLPVFKKYSQAKPDSCLEVVTDDKASLCMKYDVDVVPTVLIFEKGKVTKRLDGEAGIGLTEKQLLEFTKS
jgi:thioredoxin 1